MKFGSVCSGIEAASAAWEPLGWQSAFFSEIDRFPCSVLAHHYPGTPNHGDMTKFKEWPDANINVLVGGTPCQSFSVAGLRKGLDDPRGNLMLTFGAIAAKYRPEWLVWENVPGVLSSDSGRDFGTFLGMLGQLGYGFAYRVLDAQYFGVAQRRRRVFVVARLGDWRGAAAVLFERHSLSGNPAPSREAREETAGTLKSCASSGGWSNGVDHAAAGYMQPVTMAHGQAGAEVGFNRGPTLTCNHEAPIVAFEAAVCVTGNITHTLKAEGFDGSEDGTGRGHVIISYEAADYKSGAYRQVGVSSPITTSADRSRAAPIAIGPSMRAKNPTAVAIPIQNATRGKSQNGLGIAAAGEPMYTLDQASQHAVAFAENSRAELRLEGGDGSRTGALTSGGGKPGQGVPMVASAMRVRRLTPRECERLQGFPDDYTQVWHRNKPAADGPRYKALGNSMAVPVMAWIGKRIQQVQSHD